ncbi:serine/threonine protein kinase [Amycolatopsis antarctica]|uniref:non-specific serine/threonine protein kinase n=1 Tax=Amycolatopsis antarctica TaxID=1854586 RepID=A0A263CY41_9PSEU|nr:serine/threonine-protein kinase [Amycolatopsis antarctica]OZM71062.1 serine/threonine protein kinase [Amycolatopsis antarctica]
MIAGHYRLVEHIGSGAMGVVWRAVDERLERAVAVKQILAQPGLSEAERENVRQRAMREAKNAARLQHPNAIVVFDIAEHDGDPCLVMEYLPSKSLSAVIGESPLMPVREVARIGEQVAAALVAAHRAGIVHRDVKPGNILIDSTGITKITDFGISRATGDLALTQTGLIGGTPAYLAPELARGADPAPSSDVFALGATLYHAIEGQPPYGDSSNQLALLYTAANGKVIPPQHSGPATALLMSLLRVEPSERPSMAETRQRLAAIANAETSVAAESAHQGTLVSPPLPPHGGRRPAGPVETPGRGIEPPPWQRTPSAPAGVATPPRTATSTFQPVRQGPQRPPATPPHGHPVPAASPPAAAAPATGRKRKMIAGVGAAAVIVAAGIVVATNLGADSGDGQAQPPASSSAPAPAPSAGPPLGEATTSGPIDLSTAGNALIDFYESAGSETSWNMLTPAAQAVYGNQQAFAGYWGERAPKGYRSALADEGYNSDKSVDMYLSVQYADGTEREPVRIVNSGGSLRLDADTRREADRGTPALG